MQRRRPLSPGRGSLEDADNRAPSSLDRVRLAARMLLPLLLATKLGRTSIARAANPKLAAGSWQSYEVRAPGSAGNMGVLQEALAAYSFILSALKDWMWGSDLFVNARVQGVVVALRDR